MSEFFTIMDSCPPGGITSLLPFLVQFWQMRSSAFPVPAVAGKRLLAKLCLVCRPHGKGISSGGEITSAGCLSAD